MFWHCADIFRPAWRHCRQIQRKSLATATSTLGNDLCLDSGERKAIINELRELALVDRVRFVEDLERRVAEREAGAGAAAAAPAPTRRQLWRYFSLTAVPYVGFGFADNLLMILCGQQIEVQLGGILHISTMAAAGMGNLFSDLVGLGLGGLIERWSTQLGLQPHGMTRDQLARKEAKYTYFTAAIVGVSTGCILGLCPLFWEDAEHRRMRVLFNRLDADGSGTLDVEEIRMGFEKIHIYLNDKQIRGLIGEVCGDNDGTLDFDEFYSLFVRWRDGMQTPIE